MSRARAGAYAAGLLAGWLGACAHSDAPPPPRLSDFSSALHLRSVGAAPYSGTPAPGQVLLVTFLATWCFPCLGQLPLLEIEQKRHGVRGFQILAVGMDLEGAEVLEPFAREYSLPFPLLVADGAIRKGQTAFGPIPVLPASFLFGRDGRLITVFPGLLVPDELDQLIVRALEAS